MVGNEWVSSLWKIKWLKNVDWFDVNSVSEKSPIGCILEVDLDYPDKLHSSCNDYPLAPEKFAVSYDILSDYCKEIADKYGIKIVDVKKLILNLGSKTNYVLHYRDLRLYLSLGMRFKQSHWMKEYIDFKTEKRKNANNGFQKDFFKLMISSVYAKTMENLRKRIKVRIVTNERDFLKYTSRLTYINYKIFGKNYAAIHEIKPALKLNKPIFVGFTVLELRKWLMYDFHYNFIKKDFDAELLFTDTNSFTSEIKSYGVYEQFFKHKNLFDFSNYPKVSKLFDEANKKVIGKMKDKSEGNKSWVCWVKVKDVFHKKYWW